MLIVFCVYSVHMLYLDLDAVEFGLFARNRNKNSGYHGMHNGFYSSSD